MPRELVGGTTRVGGHQDHACLSSSTPCNSNYSNSAIAQNLLHGWDLLDNHCTLKANNRVESAGLKLDSTFSRCLSQVHFSKKLFPAWTLECCWKSSSNMCAMIQTCS